MTVKSWTEYRLYKGDGDLIGTVASKEDAAQWAKEARVAYKNPDMKFICMEVSICEVPKKRFSV